MYKISIIVPVHNVEIYLKQCLDSIVNQTIGVENLQVIMVDEKTLMKIVLQISS